MPEVGAYEAKTHLPELLKRVQQGERFIITKHGRPVAELVPITRRDGAKIRQAIEQMRMFRDQLHKRGVRLSDLFEEGEALRNLAHQGHRF